jgi:hypothetical protein
MNKNFGKLAVAVALAFSGNVWADSQEEVNKQVAKLIGDAVSTRVSSTVAADGGPQLLNNAWGSYSRLYVEPEASKRIGTDITVVGYDRDLGKDWTAGVALSYNATSRLNSHGWDVSPYVAYRFSKNYFGVLRADYSEYGAPGVDGHTTGGAASFNGVHDFGNLAAKWRVEAGASETDSRSSGTSSTASSTKYLADGELSYRFGYGLTGYVGLQVSDTNRQNTYSTFARAGLEKAIGKDAAISAKYESKVDDNLPSNGDVSVNVFTIAARLRF